MFCFCLQFAFHARNSDWFWQFDSQRSTYHPPCPPSTCLGSTCTAQCSTIVRYFVLSTVHSFVPFEFSTPLRGKFVRVSGGHCDQQRRCRWQRRPDQEPLPAVRHDDMHNLKDVHLQLSSESPDVTELPRSSPWGTWSGRVMTLSCDAVFLSSAAAAALLFTYHVFSLPTVYIPRLYLLYLKNTFF